MVKVLDIDGADQVRITNVERRTMELEEAAEPFAALVIVKPAFHGVEVARVREAVAVGQLQWRSGNTAGRPEVSVARQPPVGERRGDGDGRYRQRSQQQ